jgi:hypothetical protein
MIFETWADLIRGLDASFAFAGSLGLDEAIPASRFAIFRTRLAELDEVLQRDGDQAAARRFRGDDIEANVVALTESQEFVTLLSFLKSIPADRARMKLQVALQGPELPADEDANSNHARNTMFELNIAGRLHRAGLDVEVGGDADLAFTCDGVRWFGECKRPYKVETIKRNLGEACRQLKIHLSSSRLAARALVAISVSRPIATRAPYLEYSSATELRHKLREHVSSVVRLMEERMQALPHCREVSNLGLLIGHLIIPAWNPADGVVAGVQHSAGTDVCRDGSGDGERLWGVIKGTFTTGHERR